jgi:hypothetical protein
VAYDQAVEATMSKFTREEIETLFAQSMDLLARFSGPGTANPRDVKDLELFRSAMLPIVDEFDDLEEYQDPEAYLSSRGLEVSPGHTLPSEVARQYVARARQCLDFVRSRVD